MNFKGRGECGLSKLDLCSYILLNRSTNFAQWSLAVLPCEHFLVGTVLFYSVCILLSYKILLLLLMTCLCTIDEYTSKTYYILTLHQLLRQLLNAVLCSPASC